jgi:hypothetical protein
MIGNRATTRLLQSGALQDAGITTTSRIDDKTRSHIQTAIEESVVLRPYLKGKFPRAAATDGALREALKQKWSLDDVGFAKLRVGDGVCKRL